MEKIFITNTEGTPQFGCSLCYKCNSIFGKSLCKVKNRGCCWYFPKFTLYDIQKMIKSEEGISTLNRILKLPNIKIYNYYIHAVGYFDYDSHDKYIKNNGTCELPYATEEQIKEVRSEIISENDEYYIYEEYNEYDSDKNNSIKKPRVINDVSMFFRACPFVIDGQGCTLNKKYRTYICNFFLCDEITDNLIEESTFKKYKEERDNYIRWIEWENSSLESLLRHKNINLVKNFNDVINLLKEIEINEYEFPNLDEINIKLK